MEENKILEDFTLKVTRKEFEEILKEFGAEITDENVNKYFNYNNGVSGILKETLLNQLYRIAASIKRTQE